MHTRNPDPQADDVLASLLDAGLRHAPEYRNGLSNHLPMALVALHRIGAGAQRLRSFASIYARRLEPLVPDIPQSDRAAPAGAPSWRDHLGDVSAYGLAFSEFRHQLTRNSADEVLRATLPVLLPGVGAAAFHGLIRTAYAVAAGHAGELAAGLAYWACRYLPLGEGLAESGGLGVASWSAQIERCLSGWAPGRGLIFEQMEAVARTPEFEAAVGGLRLDRGTLKGLSALAADRYLQTQDFTVLHLVTSCHALRILGPWLDVPDEALRHFALAYAAGLVASKSGGRGPIESTEDPLPWAVIFERAVESDNDHTIKLVHTCHEEASHHGDDRYRHVATMATGS